MGSAHDPIQDRPASGAAHCTFCGEHYSLGDPSGELWIWYPDGERMYWRHTRESAAHRAALAASARHLASLLPRIDQAIAAGRAHQKLMLSPMAVRIRQLLAA